MTASPTPWQIERFRRKAKRLSRESPLSYSQALDQLANANGYGNWSLLKKHTGKSVKDNKVGASSARKPLRFTRTSEIMRLALLKVPEPLRWDRSNRIEKAQQQVEDFSQAFISAQNAVEFAIEYLTCLLKVPRFKIASAAPVYWEMRSWLPYSCHSLEGGAYMLVNRIYKPIGQVKKDWANYEDFPHLQASFPADLLKCFTAPGSNDGYLFNDRCPPWRSRLDAVAYLHRLLILSQVLKG